MNGLGLPRPDQRYLLQSIYAEIVASFFLQFALMSLYLDKRAPKEVNAIGVGGMMALAILTIGNVSGGGMNPARAIGPSIISGNLAFDLLIFVGGPAVGSTIASFFYKEFFLNDVSNTPVNCIVKDEKDLEKIEEEKALQDAQNELIAIEEEDAGINVKEGRRPTTTNNKTVSNPFLDALGSSDFKFDEDA